MSSPLLELEHAPGLIEPREYTRPLRELTPDTSYGYDVIDFAWRFLGRRLDPWQQWLLIHGCELLPDGSPRFSTVLVLVARQNGKTECLVVLAAYWLFVECVSLVLGTSTNLDYARESWSKMVALVERSPLLAGAHPPRWTRTANDATYCWTYTGSRYKVAPATVTGGRSLTIARLITDELREHRSYDSWNAATGAMVAEPGAQTWALSNAGGPHSVVLNDLLAEARAGETDDLGAFLWTAPANADPLDEHALRCANPSPRVSITALRAKARAAVLAGGERLAGFKTEHMCITVGTLNPAIDPAAWERCLDVGTLDELRSRVACCLDVAPDGQHATLAAAAVLDDGRTRVELVEAWSGIGAVDRLRRTLPALVRRVRPRKLGWFPTGPAAELAADMAKRPGWPPAGIEVEPIRGEVAASCMALAGLVGAGRIAQSGDPLLKAQTDAAERLPRGDAWVFARPGDGHVDAVYATAGAVQLARTLPPPLARRGLVVVDG